MQLHLLSKASFGGVTLSTASSNSSSELLKLDMSWKKKTKILMFHVLLLLFQAVGNTIHAAGALHLARFILAMTLIGKNNENSSQNDYQPN